MSSNNFDEVATRILSCENLRNSHTINDDLIDRNLLNESTKFVSLDRQSVALKRTELETTEQVDIRVKKCNELRERLGKFTKTMNKSFPRTSSSDCDMHQKVEPTEMSELLNQLNEKRVPVPDVESVLKTDEAMFQQHKSNMEKVNKLMETVKGYKYAEAAVPAIGEINESITLLREIVNDVDCLKESETMYSGLSKQASSYLYAEEIKDLASHLCKQ